ncbi:NAD-dependent dihydropyrimidine dehydrogenase PreA subunit [Saccharomonospora amisosensis]|uniref:NAD-dependent dihydropyrimidine dehydrogenase PreA subunit n=1 Tax=Saccharomonospora amisosensis TaxID=1128677 RepID=A0A7X5UPV1_9PSEU|nr:hypothetical protein [Saccharomonospora amisosensis]NIJ11941.1 NAD-dependent dihydropyrimidine dehydrogenase PreA subunit [Saccharomonospora amisosensis]
MDRIHIGAHSAHVGYANPQERIDCGAREPVCPVEAIMPAVDTPFVAGRPVR